MPKRKERRMFDNLGEFLEKREEGLKEEFARFVRGEMDKTHSGDADTIYPYAHRFLLVTMHVLLTSPLDVMVNCYQKKIDMNKVSMMTVALIALWQTDGVHFAHHEVEIDDDVRLVCDLCGLLTDREDNQDIGGKILIAAYQHWCLEKYIEETGDVPDLCPDPRTIEVKDILSLTKMELNAMTEGEPKAVLH
jgi:hypothetical protein